MEERPKERFPGEDKVDRDIETKKANADEAEIVAIEQELEDDRAS
jgi:hypothetical protein